MYLLTVCIKQPHTFFSRKDVTGKEELIASWIERLCTRKKSNLIRFQLMQKMRLKDPFIALYFARRWLEPEGRERQEKNPL
jgi:hypothetical protein